MIVKAIEIKNFHKAFGQTVVIKDLSFDVYAGEIFAFLGANGSGKTTTLRSLLGIYQPDGGELLVYGKKYSTELSSILGYLPEERGLYVDNKVIDAMTYMGQLKGMTVTAARASASKYLERVGLSDKKNLPIKKLSSGQQQKIQLGMTVINRPKLLILDEPTKGLDPVNRNLLLEILLELKKENDSTIIFSTHQMEEAEKIADRLVMIKDGDRRLYGTIEEVKEKFGNNIVHVEYSGKFPENPKLYTASVQTNSAELTPKTHVTHDQIIRALVDSDIQIHEFKVGAPSLNEIFIKVSQSDKQI